MNVSPARFVEAIVQSPDDGVREVLGRHRQMVMRLARLENLEVTGPGKRPPSSATAVWGDTTIFVSLKDIIDFTAEQERLKKEIVKIEKELTGVEKKLSNESFLAKAPADVVEGVRVKKEQFVTKKSKLEKHLETVEDLAKNA
jgi:valyl-tRNA synthetase